MSKDCCCAGYHAILRVARLSVVGAVVGVMAFLGVGACTARSTPFPTPVPIQSGPFPTLTPGAAQPAESAPTRVASAARGEAAYRRYCVSCHGEDGRGDSVMGRTLTPRPPNFQDAGFFRVRTPVSLYRSISNGVLGTAMQGFKGSLSEEERWDVLAYVWRFHLGDGTAAGATLYAAECSACHGADGRGGEAALGDPRFLAGRTGRGMYTAMSGGLPGRAEHTWEQLSADERWAIVEHVWGFMFGP